MIEFVLSFPTKVSIRKLQLQWDTGPVFNLIPPLESSGPITVYYFLCHASIIAQVLSALTGDNVVLQLIALRIRP